MRDNLRAVRLRVGRNVRHLRRQRGWSQEALAELVGNTSKHVGQIERGEVNVTLDILTAVAAALGVNVGELFGPPAAATPGLRDYPISPRDLEHIEHSLRIVARLKQTRRRRREHSATD
jgi:transcriptional regulator with XRE-family HTH domain